MIEIVKMDELSSLEKLMTYLIPKLMAGGAADYGERGTIYLKQICRLIDKAISEYEKAREHFIQDGKDAQSLHLFEIMDHIENSVNATRRGFLFLDKIRSEKDFPPLSRLKVKLVQSNSAEIGTFRNSIEHFDERAQAVNGPILLTISKDGKKALLGDSELDLTGLCNALKHFHSMIKELILMKPSEGG